MKIAVFSDSHDNIDALKNALEVVKKLDITQGIHLGDFSSPPAMELIAQAGIPWTCVWGNIDYDKIALYTIAKPYNTIDVSDGDFREVTIADRSLFLTHYPEIARLAALSGKYDAMFHGHTHRAAQEILGNTLLANPGELCGYRYGQSSFAVYNTEDNTLEHMYI